MKKIIIIALMIVLFISGVLTSTMIVNRKTKIEIGNWKGPNFEIGKIKTKEYNKTMTGFSVIPKNKDDFYELIDNTFKDCKKESFSRYYKLKSETYEVKGDLYIKDDNCYFLTEEENKIRLIGLYSMYFYTYKNVQYKTFIVFPEDGMFQYDDTEFIEDEIFNYSFNEALLLYESIKDYVKVDEENEQIYIKGFNNERDKKIVDHYSIMFDFKNQKVFTADDIND